MAQYKTVAGPISIPITTQAEYEDAIASFATLINAEAVGGWEFYEMYPVQVNKTATGIKKRFNTWAGADMQDGLYSANMLVFKKD